MRWGCPSTIRSTQKNAKYVPNTTQLPLRGARGSSPATAMELQAQQVAPPQVAKSQGTPSVRQRPRSASISIAVADAGPVSSSSSSSAPRREYEKPWLSQGRRVQSPRASLSHRHSIGLPSSRPSSSRPSRGEGKIILDSSEADMRPPQFGLVEPSVAKKAPKFQPSAKRRPRSRGVGVSDSKARGASLSIQPEKDCQDDKKEELISASDNFRRHSSSPLLLSVDGSGAPDVAKVEIVRDVVTISLPLSSAEDLDSIPKGLKGLEYTALRCPSSEDIETFSFADFDFASPDRRAQFPTEAQGRGCIGVDQLPLETPREAALRRKREVADREMARMAQVTASHVADQPVRPRPSAASDASAFLVPVDSDDTPWAVDPNECESPRSPRPRSRSSNAHSHSPPSVEVTPPSAYSFASVRPSLPPPSASRPPDHQVTLAWGSQDDETPREAARRRKVEAADRDLARLKAQQSEVNGTAVQIAVQVRDAQARSFQSPFATAARMDIPRPVAALNLGYDDVAEGAGFPHAELPSHSVLTPIS